MFFESNVRVSTDPTVELFVAQKGSAGDPALLVVHGGPDWDHTYLRDPLAELTGRRLLLPDLRGCGRSTKGLLPPQYDPDAAVHDLITLLGELDVEVAYVLGFSYGGALAQRLTLTAPGRVRRLIIASSAVLPVPPDAFAGWHERDERRAASPPAWDGPAQSGADLVRAAAFADATLNVRRQDSLSLHLQRLGKIRFSGEWLRAWRAGNIPEALPANAVQRLSDLQIPLLLLHGLQDMIFPVSLTREANRQIPSARAVVIDDAGHMTHVDQPASWLTAVREFLS